MIDACEAFAAELVAYFDGEHTETDAARVEAHLGTCLACRREIERLRRLRALLGELRPLEPSADFREGMWRRLDAVPPRAVRRSRAVLWTVPALAAAAAVALVWYSSIARIAGEGSAARDPRSLAAASRPRGDGDEAMAQRGHEGEREERRDVADAGNLDRYPPELVEHPELFLRLPVVRRLQKLQHFEEVQQHTDDEPLGRLAPHTPSVG